MATRYAHVRIKDIPRYPHVDSVAFLSDLEDHEELVRLSGDLDVGRKEVKRAGSRLTELLKVKNLPESWGACWLSGIRRRQ